jgi:hypothetical protein
VPLSLNKGQSVTFSVLFTPKVVDRASGAIAGFECFEPTLTIALAGSGISGSRLTSSPTELRQRDHPHQQDSEGHSYRQHQA